MLLLLAVFSVPASLFLLVLAVGGASSAYRLLTRWTALRRGLGDVDWARSAERLGLAADVEHQRDGLARASLDEVGRRVEVRAPRVYVGTADGLAVELGPAPRLLGGLDEQCVVVVGGVPPGVELLPRAERDGMFVRVAETGDAAFDGLGTLSGDEARVLAACDHEVRGRVRAAALDGAVEVRDGFVRLELLDGAASDVADSRVATGVWLVKRIAANLTDPRALLRRATDEPHHEVRTRAILVLAEAGATVLPDAIARARVADHPQVRLVGVWLDAAAGGPWGEDLPDVRSLPAQVAVRLLARVPSAPRPALDAGLLAFLTGSVPEVRVAAVQAVARRRTPEARALVEACLQPGRSGDVARAAFEALRAWPGDNPVPALLLALDRPEPDLVEAAASEATARGDARLLPLLAAIAAGTGRVRHPSGTRAAARVALDALRGRLPGVGEGMLTLAEEGVAGAVSVAAEGGGVTVVPEGGADVSSGRAGR